MNPPDRSGSEEHVLPSAEDERRRVCAELVRIRRVVRLMEAEFRVPGTQVRFGLDPLLGLLPFGGDLAGWFVSMSLVWKARRIGVPPETLRKMSRIALTDAVLGYLPVLGDASDWLYRANSRNLVLVDQALEDLRERAPKLADANRGSLRSLAWCAYFALALLLAVLPWWLVVAWGVHCSGL